MSWSRYYLATLQQEFANELNRRLTGIGGQQAGIPKYSSMPLSLLIELERDCRHMLQRSGHPEDSEYWDTNQVPPLYVQKETK